MKLLKFSAKWCGPCKQQDREFKEHPIKIPVVSIDIDENEEDAIKYSVSSIPKMVLLGDDNKTVHQWIGFTESWLINDFINGGQATAD